MSGRHFVAAWAGIIAAGLAVWYALIELVLR